MFASMTIRNIWSAGPDGNRHIERTPTFNSVMKAIADEKHLLFIDMANVEANRLEATGEENAKPLFPIDHTHTSAGGAELNARDVVIALEIAKSPLVRYLKEQIPIPPIDLTTSSPTTMPEPAGVTNQ